MTVSDQSSPVGWVTKAHLGPAKIDWVYFYRLLTLLPPNWTNRKNDKSSSVIAGLFLRAQNQMHSIWKGNTSQPPSSTWFRVWIINCVFISKWHRESGKAFINYPANRMGAHEMEKPIDLSPKCHWRNSIWKLIFAPNADYRLANPSVNDDWIFGRCFNVSSHNCRIFPTPSTETRRGRGARFWGRWSPGPRPRNTQTLWKSISIRMPPSDRTPSDRTEARR